MGKTIFDTCHEAFETVRKDGNIALFSDVSYFSYHLNLDCELEIIPDYLANVRLAFAVNKQFGTVHVAIAR